MIEPFRSDEHLLDASDNRLKYISEQIHKQGVAVFYDQSFTESQIISLQKTFRGM